MAVHRARSGLRGKTARHFQFRNGSAFAISSRFARGKPRDSVNEYAGAPLSTIRYGAAIQDEKDFALFRCLVGLTFAHQQPGKFRRAAAFSCGRFRARARHDGGRHYCVGAIRNERKRGRPRHGRDFLQCRRYGSGIFSRCQTPIIPSSPRIFTE